MGSDAWAVRAVKKAEWPAERKGKLARPGGAVPESGDGSGTRQDSGELRRARKDCVKRSEQKPDGLASARHEAQKGCQAAGRPTVNDVGRKGRWGCDGYSEAMPKGVGTGGVAKKPR